MHGQEYSEAAYKNQMKNQVISPKRGKIYDVNGNILAMSIAVETISVNPGKISYSNKKEVENEVIAQGLAETLELDYNEVFQKITNAKSSVVVIAKKVSEEKAENLRTWLGEKKITSGINIDEDTKRYYPYNNVASNLIGICNDDNSGTIGIESRWNTKLTGMAGKIVTVQDVHQNPISDEMEQYVPVENGSNLYLTIDVTVQQIAEKYLKQAVEENACSGGGNVIIMNPQNGEILAMATYPDYNLNEPYNIEATGQATVWDTLTTTQKTEAYHKLWVNKSVSQLYEPGSTFKMVTAIAGLETGVINLNTTINDTGIYRKYRDYQPRCWVYTDYHTGHGYLNVSGAIEKSCNYFFYETADKMGIENLVKYAKYFGLGNKTGIELPSETAGALASKETWSKLHPQNEPWGPGQVLQAAIGQSDNEFSPLQMARYISMLANGGQKVDVSIVKTIRNADGSEVSREEINQFINKKLGLEQDNTENLEINQNYLKAVLEGMKSVTSDTSGTAYIRFKDFDITVGGKTGSAEAPNNQVHAWFVGFAPFEDPEIAIVVMVENGGHGNYTAEVVRDIMTEYFGMNTQNVEEDMSATPYIEIMN